VRAGSGSPAAGPTARPTRCDDPYGCGPSAMSTDTPYAVGLKAQTDLAVQHAQNASNAAAIGSLAELRVHLEHLINILEGANGARFGDYDGDGQKQNPGDGYGVVLYLTRMGDHASNAESARALIDGARKQITAIEDKAVEISKAPNAASAANSLKDLKAMADKLKNEPVAQIYQMAQDSLKFPVTVKP